MDYTDILKMNAETVWRRVHRPEDYAADAAKFVADELRLPKLIVRPFIPLARTLLTKWDDAAIETTALFVTPDGSRVLRTFFEITDYSNASIYGFLEAILKKLGVGADFTRKYGETDFAWVLLGGVLDDYAHRARLCRKTTRELIDFRFPLSDYFTATTWYPDYVEITNLRTGRAETLQLNPREVAKIIDWTIKFENDTPGADSSVARPGSPEYTEYLRLAEVYTKMRSAKTS